MSEITRTVLFADTNAIHRAALYLRYAQRNGLFPFGQDEPTSDANLAQLGKMALRTSLLEGRKLTSLFRARCEGGAQVEYSPVTSLEMACGILRGLAIIAAADENIPSRMWSKIDEQEVIGRLDGQNYATATAAVDGLSDEFAAVGIDLQPTDVSRFPDVWRLSRSLLSLVFLDVQDCLVYSGSVLAEAEHLVTADGFLRTIASAIENPGGVQHGWDSAQFTTVRQGIISLVAPVLGIPEAEVRLPKAGKIW